MSARRKRNRTVANLLSPCPALLELRRKEVATMVKQMKQRAAGLALVLAPALVVLVEAAGRGFP
jgi:hypothetical protein